MENIKITRTHYVIGGLVLLVLILISVIIINSRKSQPKETKKTDETTQQESIIPTIDSSTLVDLAAAMGSKEVIIKIDNIISSTKMIDYELSYQTRQQGLQGVIGTIQLEEDERSLEKQITLGTCSSGKCVYHEVIGGIKLTLKFTGSYGEKIFEKEYQL